MAPGPTESSTQFIEISTASARALGQDIEGVIDLSCSADALPLDLIAPLQSQSDKLVRGLADSLALIRVHHDPVVHLRYTPAGALAQQLFVAMERARCEACGSERLAGAASNLSTFWLKTSGQVNCASSADLKNLPVVFSYLTRESLQMPLASRDIGTYKDTDTLKELVEYWRAVIVGNRVDQWRRLHLVRESQPDFALLAKQLIDSINAVNKQSADSTETISVVTTSGEDDEVDEADTSDPLDGEPEDDSDPDLTVNIREEAEVDSEATISDDSDNSVDEISLANRDSPVNVDSENSGDGRYLDTAEYRVFSTRDDEIVAADNFCSTAELAELRRALDTHLQRHSRLVGKLSGKLQRVLMTQQQRHWVFDLEEGILDTSRLSRVVIDPVAALSFKQESDLLFKDTVVTVLVDNSKSMLGKPIAIAAACSDLLSQTLERCGVSVEILGFTTTQLHGGDLLDRWKEQGSKQRPGRLNGLRHIIYKAADTPYRRARKCFGLMLHKEILKQNIDGEALLWAYRRLQHRPERRKILMVISDGAPIDTSTMAANDGNFLIDHLHQVVATIEKNRDIELMAIGIGHDVSRYYRNAMSILDVKDLGKSMLAQLSSLFGRPH